MTPSCILHPTSCIQHPSPDIPHARPRFWHEQALEERHGVAVSHAGDEVADGGVDAFLSNGAGLEELGRLFAQALPEPAEYPCGFLELGRRDLVLVDGVEQKCAKFEGGPEHLVAHPNLG